MKKRWRLLLTGMLLGCGGAPETSEVHQAASSAVELECANPSIPRYRLEFDQPKELEEKEACYRSTSTGPCLPALVADPGYVDQGARLTSGYLAIPGAAISPKRGSMSMWVRPESGFEQSDHELVLLDSDATASSDWRFYIAVRGDLRSTAVTISLKGEGTQGVTKRVALPLWTVGDWHHLAISWDEGLSLFIDGVAIFNHPTSPGFASTPRWLYLLGSGRLGDFVSAEGLLTVDSLRFFDGRLSDETAFALAAEPPVKAPLIKLTFDQPGELSSYGVCHQTQSSGCELSANALADGRMGQSARPSEGRLQMPAANALDMDQGTMTMWLGNEGYVGASNHYFTLVDTDKGSGAAHPWRYYLGRALPTGKEHEIQFHGTEVPTQGFGLFRSISAWYPGEWHQLTMTWDASLVRFYIDGQLVGSTARPSGFPTNQNMPNNLYLLSSGRVDSESEANGRFRLDDFRTWDVALSEAQIERMFTRERDEGVTRIIDDERLMLTFLGEKDGFGMAAMSDQKTCAQKLISAPDRLLWRLKFQHTSDPTKWILIENTAAFQSTLSASRDRASLELSWTQIPLPDSLMLLNQSTEAFDVRVTFTEGPGYSEVQGFIEVDYPGIEWTLTNVFFPTVQGVVSPQHLVMPNATVGQLYPAPADPHTELPQSALYPSRFMHMQWLGLTNASRIGNVYLGTHDEGGWIKEYKIARATHNESSVRGLNVEVRTPATRAAATPGGMLHHAPSWPAVWALEDGGWFELARRYRDDFALSQAHVLAPLASRPDAPEALMNSSVALSGSSNLISVKAANDLGALEPGAEQVFLWRARWDAANHVYTDQSLDNNSPYLTPLNLEGQLQDSRIKTSLYLNPTIHDRAYDNPSGTCEPPWTGGLQPEDVAMRNESGGLRLGHQDPCAISCGPYTEPCRRHVEVCPAAQPFRDLLDDQLSSFFGTVTASTAYPNIDGYYFDVVAAYVPRLCFSDAHGHVPGGGDHWTQGHRATIAQLRASVAQHVPGAELSSESFADAYVGPLDGFLIWDAIAPRPVPLAQAVYHDRTVFYGLATYETETMDAKVAKQAQLFAWGAMPGFALFAIDAVAHTEFREYLYTLARLRVRFKDWVVLGDMLKPPQMIEHLGFSGPPQLFSGVTGEPLPELERALRNTAGQPVRAWVPAVRSSAWRAPDGRVGVVVVSTRAAPAPDTPVFIPIDRSAWGLGKRPLSVRVEALGGPVLVSPSILVDEDGISLDVSAQETLLVIIENLD